MMEILVISDTDSRKGWSNLLAQSLKFFYYSSLINYIDYSSFNSFSAEVLGVKIQSSNIVIVALGGGANFKVIKVIKSYFLSTNSDRPIIITGFNGITNPYNVHSLNCRLGSDIICVNTVFDYDVFNKYLKKLDYQQSPLHLLGFLQATDNVAVNFFEKYKFYERKVVFIVQPDVPKSLTERFYVIEKLVELAKKYSSWGVFIKARSQVGEANVTHQESHPYEIIYKSFNQLDNIHFIYGDMVPILDSLDDKDIVLSIGSTVIMHCLQKGINVGVISDFGVRVDYGTEHFVGSNLFIELSDINEYFDKKLLPSQTWLDKYFDEEHNGVVSLFNKIESLINKQKISSKMLPFNSTMYNESFSQYLSSSYSISKYERYKFKLRKKRFVKTFSQITK
ncbi:MAG: DUF6716 putative glycosyltransferase [Psychrobacter celer]